MIRLGSAVQLCDSVSINKTLTYLDLSFNALGHDGGIALGNSLLHNKVLKTLLVANNSFDSMACITVCAGILENENIEKVVFDGEINDDTVIIYFIINLGNPIGQDGARVLMVMIIIIV